MTCVTSFSILFLFTQVDLAAIVIHKWVLKHGIHFIPRFCPKNPAPGAADQPPRAAQSGRTLEFGYWAVRALSYIIFTNKKTRSVCLSVCPVIRSVMR